MEILEVVAGPTPAGLCIEHFGVLTGVATPVDAREVLEEQPGPVEERQQRTISIPGQRVKAGFNIGEVRAEESRHVAIKPLPIWNRCARAVLATFAVAVLCACPFGHPAHDVAMADVPEQPRKL